jgi:hypothetical protein
MAWSTKRRATYRDLLEEVPEHQVGEVLDGDLYASLRPSSRHALASSRLGSDIGGPFDRGRGGPGGWWILDEPELHLGTDVLVARPCRLASRAPADVPRYTGVHAGAGPGVRDRFLLHGTIGPREEDCRCTRAKACAVSGC